MRPLLSLLSLVLSAPLTPPLYAQEPTAVPAEGEGETASEALRTFEVRGLIKGIRTEKKIVILEHEEIPGYMKAMVMPLSFRDIKEVEGVAAGDRVLFRLNVTESEDWIDRIRVQAKASENPKPPAPEPAPLTPLEKGQSLPDADLVDQSGKPLKLSSHRGDALALTFIYTRCPLPTFCPRINSHFQKTQELLLKNPDAPKNWKLLSVSIDPEHDTPAFLSAFASAWRADPAHWNFATGTLRDITALSLRCGLRFWDDKGLIQHNLRTLVVRPDGVLHAVFAESDWTPADLAQALTEAARTARES